MIQIPREIQVKVYEITSLRTPVAMVTGSMYRWWLFVYCNITKVSLLLYRSKNQPKKLPMRKEESVYTTLNLPCS